MPAAASHVAVGDALLIEGGDVVPERLPTTLAADTIDTLKLSADAQRTSGPREGAIVVGLDGGRHRDEGSWRRIRRSEPSAEAQRRRTHPGQVPGSNFAAPR